MAWMQDVERLTHLLEEPARPTPSPIPPAPAGEGGGGEDEDGGGDDNAKHESTPGGGLAQRRPSHDEQIANDLEKFVVSSARAPWPAPERERGRLGALLDALCGRFASRRWRR